MAERMNCVEEFLSGNLYSGVQCSRAAKHDPDDSGTPTKCWQHSSAYKQQRDDKWKRKHAVERRALEAKWAEEARLRAIGVVYEDLLGALKRIESLANARPIFYRRIAREAIAKVEGKHQ